MIRSILTILFMVVSFIITLPYLIILCIVGIWNRDLEDKMGRPVVMFLCRGIMFFNGLSLEVKGLENLPPENETVLFVGNHRSMLDPLIFFHYIKRPTCFVAKKEISKVPILKQWLLVIHCLYIDRHNLKQSVGVIIKAIENIKKGYSVYVFPEGTRSKTLDMLEFKEGSFKVATKTNSKIVPIAQWKSDELFDAHKPFMKSSKIQVEICPYIDTALLSKEEQKHVGERCREVIEEKLKILKT